MQYMYLVLINFKLSTLVFLISLTFHLQDTRIGLPIFKL